MAAAAARALISAYEPFLGGLALGSGAGVGVRTVDGLAADEVAGATGRVGFGKDDDVGEGLPLDVKVDFLEADNADFSVRGRGVLLDVLEVVVGLADPV